jgi:hypothetical protein
MHWNLFKSGTTGYSPWPVEGAVQIGVYSTSKIDSEKCSC